MSPSRPRVRLGSPSRDTVAPDAAGRDAAGATQSEAYTAGTRGPVRVRRSIDGFRRVHDGSPSRPPPDLLEYHLGDRAATARGEFPGFPVTPPTVYEHYRPTDAAYPDGIYRVVGASDGRVTLLRVADADGHRANTGELVTVDADDLDGFTPAGNPDGNRSLADSVVSAVRTVPWSVLAFARQLVANPRPAAVALALLALGSFGAGVVRLPDPAWDALVLVGAVALAYVGSGRA